MRLQLGRPGETGARKIALQLPFPEPEQELGACSLVERFLRSTSVQLRAQRRELWIVLARDEHVAEPAVGLRVEVVGRQLGQPPQERRMRDAGGENVALQAIACVEESRRVLPSSRSSPTRRRKPCQRLAGEIEPIREQA